MKKLHISILLSFVTLVFVTMSCEKLEIPTQETPASPEENDNTTPTNVDSISDVEAYSIDNIIGREYEREENVFVVGYIVGYLSSNTMKSGVFAVGDVESNILMADTPVEKDYRNCIPIQLATSPIRCKQTRDSLNLADNPHMLGKKVRLQGNIDTYMGVKGIKEAKMHTLLVDDFDYEAYYASLNDTTQTEEPNEPNDTINNEQPNEPEPQDSEGQPTLNDTIEYVDSHGIEPDSAFHVSDFKTYIPVYLEKNTPGAIGWSNSYVRGYIVGYIPENTSISKTIFGYGTTETNIVLADSPTETDYNQCIGIQLSTNYKETRQALNLCTNPENLGKHVIVFGNIAPYMGTLGLKSTREYQFIE